MRCPKCKSLFILILNSFYVDNSTKRRRKYKCLACSKLFNSIELSVEEYRELLKK